MRMAWRAGPEDDGLTVAAFLRRRLNPSRGFLRRLQRQGGIQVDGQAAALRQAVRCGQEIRLAAEEAPSAGVRPEPLPLAVVYEDPFLLAVNKPAGMATHPGPGHTGGTLANAVAFHLQAQGATPAVHPVHRLDLGTSGLVLLARHAYVQQQLNPPGQGPSFHREYVALVAGCLRGPIRLEWPIAAAPGAGRWAWKGAAGAGDAGTCPGRLRPAQTLVTPLRRWPRVTLVRVQLATGRTHQIRIHLAAAGFPVLGDSRYGPPPADAARKAPGAEGLLGLLPPNGIFLHAARLRLTHPVTGEGLRLLAPWPAYWLTALRRLGAGCAAGEEAQ